MKKEYESGRSMIEMLGVLAIIGVLSVGGIAGYTSAMRSHRANEIVNATSMLFMLGLAQNAGEGTGTLEYSSVAAQLPTGCGGITYKGDKATLDVNIEDETICKQVKTKLGDKVTAGDCSSSPYNLTITFGETTPEPQIALKGEEEECSANDECMSGRCGEYGCFPLSKGGEPCTKDFNCWSGSCSTTTHKCLGEELGDLCDPDTGCKVGTCIEPEWLEGMYLCQ